MLNNKYLIDHPMQATQIWGKNKLHDSCIDHILDGNCLETEYYTTQQKICDQIQLLSYRVKIY